MFSPPIFKKAEGQGQNSDILSSTSLTKRQMETNTSNINEVENRSVQFARIGEATHKRKCQNQQGTALMHNLRLVGPTLLCYGWILLKAAFFFLCNK
uniref:Uncharacterized protein n=1 Tax=Rhipicephalus zambeziensis TaxID=60191 RepID=A0A224YDY8_9ACAR